MYNTYEIKKKIKNKDCLVNEVGVLTNLYKIKSINKYQRISRMLNLLKPNSCCKI